MSRIDYRRIVRISRKKSRQPLEWAVLPGKWHWFGSGREALLALIRSPAVACAGCKSVLLPAFCPEGVFAPFQREGWQIRFYDLDPSGHPVLDQVRGLAGVEKPGIAVLIHLFGIPRDTRGFRDALGPGVWILEDFAHTWPGPHLFFDRVQGDAALFSLPKLAGLPDGGGVFFQDYSLPEGRKGSGKRSVYLVLRILALFCSGLAWRLDAGGLRFLSIALNGRAYRILQTWRRRPHQISRISRWLLRRFDHRFLIAAHLRQADLYRMGLGTPGIVAPDPLPSWPMIGFPLFSNQRDQWVQYLSENGIDALTFTSNWNFIPESEKEKYPGALELEKTHFLLPINPKLSDEDIQTVIRVVKAFLVAGS